MKRQLCLVFALLVPFSVLVSSPVTTPPIWLGWSFWLDQPALSAPASASFLSVEAKQSSSGLSIVWKVTDPAKVSYFTLEKAQQKNQYSLVGGFRTNGQQQTLYSYQDPLYTPEIPTTYRVKMVMANREVVYSSPVLVGPQLAMIDYHHAASDKLRLAFPAPIRQLPSVELFDQLGNPVAPISLTQQGADQVELSTTHLSPGLYILRVRQAESTWVKRFIKQ